MTQDKVVNIPEKNLDRLIAAIQDANDAGMAAKAAEQIAQEKKLESQRANTALKSIRDLVGEALDVPPTAKLDLQHGTFVWQPEVQEHAAPPGAAE